MREKVVYKIVNKKNDKKYIGSTNDKGRRWYNHKWRLANNCHRNQHLQRAYNKYGSDNFEFVVVEQVDKISDLIQREQYYMDILEPEYNINPKADRSEFSEETRKKISESHKGKEMSREARRRMSESHKGKEMPKETREKIGKSISGMNNPFYGQHHSKKAKQKISETHKGKEISKETREKMSKSAKGIKNPSSKLTKKKVKVILYLLNGDSFTHKQIGKMFGVARGTITNISIGRNWEHVSI